MTIKVRDLAKELSVPEKDILEQLNKLYVDAEDGASSIDDEIAGLVRIKLGGSIAPKKTVKKKPKVVKKPVKKKTKKEEKEKAAEKKKPVKTKKIEDKAKKIKSKSDKKKASDKKEPKKFSDDTKTKGKKVSKSVVEVIETKTPGINIIKRAEPVEIVEKKSVMLEVDKKVKKVKKKGSPKKKSVIEIVEKPGMAKRKGKFPQRKTAKVVEEITGPVISRKTPKKVELQVPVSIRDLAPNIDVKPNMVIQFLMNKGMVVNINQDLEEETVREIMEYFGYELELPKTADVIEQELVAEHYDGDKKDFESRAPVVTFMGHVDHGKTSLLDYIRKTMVTKGEKGGITQHIGAYKVETSKGAVAFLDTPGHAAFTAMRARGAHATDVVVLVVAADDGVMPQTKEAIDHARAANVPIVVAINKCDLPGANPDKVRKDLQVEDLAPEEWGGKTVMVEVSAHTGEGVDSLVEMLMLESEMLELKANPKLRARGVVIESKKTAGQGIVVTLLVQNGTLKFGDIVFSGDNYGKVKAMNNDKGQRVDSALPATPVEVLGLQGVPEAGDEFFVVKDEKKAKTLTLLKQSDTRDRKMGKSQRITLEDLHNRILGGDVKELKVVLKADVQGSVEALKQSLEELSADEVKVSMLHCAAGNINESDIMLAMVSDAIVIGFHVKIEPKAEALSKKEQVDVHLYDIIYEAIADVKAGMEGLLEPEENEVFQGSAVIKEIFSSKAGKAAGCAVTKGVIRRKDRIRLKRGKEVVFEGEISALKRFKDDVKDVREGFECGISIKGFNNINKGDVIEAFVIEKIARRLEK